MNQGMNNNNFFINEDPMDSFFTSEISSNNKDEHQKQSQQDKIEMSSNLELEPMEWDTSTFSNLPNDGDSFFLNLFNTDVFESISNNNNNNNNNSNQELKFEIEPNKEQLSNFFNASNNFVEAKQIPIAPIKQEEVFMEKIPQSKKSKTENASQPKKKSKKDMTPEELEQKKKLQLEKRLVKNRRTAEVSRKRKKAKKLTLEESLQQLSLQSKDLEKQSIEVSCENRVLKTEYFALLSLILNTPALAKKFDKISEIVVDQKEKSFMMDSTGQMASVYLLNIIYSIHQQWINLKNQMPNGGQTNLYPNTSIQNVIVN